MNDIQWTVVDTFTDKIFHGEPVAVCYLQESLNDELLHAITLENHYSETVFLQSLDSGWWFRAFNSQGEIFSQGHGLLAAAHVCAQKTKAQHLEFKTVLGSSKIILNKDRIYLEYPHIQVQPGSVPEAYFDFFSIRPQQIVQNGPDVIALFDSPEQVAQCQVQVVAFKQQISGALVLTAKGGEWDVYCRSFTPRVSLQEETATPAIYSRLFYWWSGRLQNKSQLGFQQGLMRRSEVHVWTQGAKCYVGGYARSYIEGYLVL